MVLSALCLMVKTHRHPTSFFPAGKMHLSQVPFFSRAFISVFIVSRHSPFLPASWTVMGMSSARREVRKALAMSVTHSLVIFIRYLEFQETCYGEYRSGGTPLFLLGRSVKGSGSGVNLSLLVTLFITGDSSLEWRSLTSCWTFSEGSSLVVLVPPTLTETCSLAPSTCSFGIVYGQPKLPNQLGGSLVFSPCTSSWLLKKYYDSKKSQSIVTYMMSDWAITLIPLLMCSISNEDTFLNTLIKFGSVSFGNMNEHKAPKNSWW